jgi:hypothetical protein
MFSAKDRNDLFEALLVAAVEFSYEFTDATIEATHLHWIVAHNDAVAAMAGRLKNRMRQKLGRGRIWTHGSSQRLLFGEEDRCQARAYLTKHGGLRTLAGETVRLSPGKAGGFQ